MYGVFMSTRTETIHWWVHDQVLRNASPPGESSNISVHSQWLFFRCSDTVHSVRSSFINGGEKKSAIKCYKQDTLVSVT